MSPRPLAARHGDAPAPRRWPAVGRLVLLHTRYQFLETVRVPIAVVGVTVFPAVSLLFFVAPQPFAQDRSAATGATIQLAVFAVLSVCLFTVGTGTAEDRDQPWEPFVRALPVGPGPRLTGRLLTGLAFALLGLAPLVLVAALLTAASLPPERLLPTAGALAIAGAPLLGLGAAVGYAMPARAALAVAQLLLLPLAFGGGLFFPPEFFPGWLDAVSVWLPSRAGRDLAVAAAGVEPLSVLAVPVLAGWTVLLCGLAVVAYRRDEGRRFR